MSLWDPIKTEGGTKAPASTGGLWGNLTAPSQPAPAQPPAPRAVASEASSGIWAGFTYAPPTPQLSPSNPQPEVPAENPGIFGKIKGFVSNIFKKDEISTPSEPNPNFKIPETQPQIKVPAGLKYGDTFVAKEDGNTYIYLPPPLTGSLPKLERIAGGQVGDVAADTTPITTDKNTIDNVVSAAKQIHEENKNVSFKDFLSAIPEEFSKQVGQPQIRAYGAVGNFLTGQHFTPTGQFQQDLYGTNKELTLSRAGREARGGNPDEASHGIFKYIDPVTGLVVGSLDALDGGALQKLSGVMKLGRSTREIIAASDDVIQIADTLKKEFPVLTDTLATRLAEPLRYINDVNDVDKVLNRTKYQLQEAAKIPEQRTLPGSVVDENVASDIQKLPISNQQKNALQAIREGYVSDDIVKVARTVPQEVLDSMPVQKGSIAAKKLGMEVTPEKPAIEDTKAPKNTPGSEKTIKAFENSKEQRVVATNKENIFEIGTYGENAIARKSSKEDRLPVTEIPSTIKNIASVYKAGSDPFRKDNLVWVSKMDDGELRAVVTRENKAGNNEIINIFKIGKNPEKFIDNLREFGVPGRSRTGISNLEGSQSNPLTYRDIKNITKSNNSVNGIIVDKSGDNLPTGFSNRHAVNKTIQSFFSPGDAKVLFSDKVYDAQGREVEGKVSFHNDALTGKLKALIELVENNGLVKDKIAFEEAFHTFLKLKVPELERKIFFNKVKRNILTLPKRTAYMAEGYNQSADERAEEWAAKDFAEWYSDQKNHKTPFKSFYQRILERIRQFIRKITKAQDYYDQMVERAKKTTVSEKAGPTRFSRSREPSDYKVANEANAERNKVTAKESEKNREVAHFAKQEEEIGNLLYERDSLVDALEADPARKLGKYANENGEIPENALQNSGKFATQGDDIATQLGFDDSEQAREAYQKYRQKVEKYKDLNQTIKEKKAALAEAKLAYKEEKVLGKMADKSEAEAAKLREKEKKEKLKAKDLEETNKRLIQEEVEKQTLGEKIRAAQKESARSKGFFAKVKQILKPIKGVDEKTRELIEKWAEDKIMAKVAGQETWLEMRTKGPQTMKEINEYEAGKNTPYIRFAMDDLGTEAKRAGLEFGWRSDYLPHVYAQGPKAVAKAMVGYLKAKGLSDEAISAYMGGEQLSKDVSLRLKLRPNFVKERLFPTYEAAANYGLTPRFRTPAQLIGHYREALDTAIANRELLQNLKSEAKLLAPEDAPDTWVPVTKRFAREGLYARPELAELINGKFRDEENLGIWDRIAKGASGVSKFMQEIVLSAGVPFTNINYFSIGQANKLLTTAIGEALTGKFRDAASSLRSSFAFIRANSNTASAKWFYENRAYMARAALEGIDIADNVGSYKEIHQSFKELMPKFDKEMGIYDKTKEVVGAGKHMFKYAFEKAFNEKTFKSMMGQITLQTFKDAYNGAIDKGMNDKAAGKFAAEVTSAFNGITRETGRGKTTEDTISSVLFAPRFRESLVNVFAESLKGTTSEFRNAAYAKNRSFLVGMAVVFALYQLINKKTSGQYTWQNPPGREFSIRYLLPDGSTAYMEFMPSILAFPRNMAEGAISLAKGDWDTAGQKIGTIFSMPLKTLTELFTNSDYFGRQIYDPADSSFQKTKDMAKYVGVGINHPFISETSKYLTGKEPLYQALSYMMEFPLKFSTMTKEDTSAYYDALDKQQQDRKNAKANIKKIYDSNQKLKEEGKVAEANKVYNDLNKSEKYVYDQIKSDAKRTATNKRKPAIQKIYNQLQDLKASGRVEEANDIYQGLSDDDKRIYDSIKKQAQIDAGL